MDNLDKDLRMSTLFDYYGELLTEKQKDFFDLYYNEDLSLSEIAEHENITRQGVRDGIKHAEQKLSEYETKLRLAERSETYYALSQKITALAEEIRVSSFSRNTVMEKAAEIERLMKKYKDLF